MGPRASVELSDCVLITPFCVSERRTSSPAVYPFVHEIVRPENPGVIRRKEAAAHEKSASGMCIRGYSRHNEMKANLNNLLKIYARQKTGMFGAAYTPAIQATKFEAPRISWATIMRSERLGRSLHLLSSAEKQAALLALYNPFVFDLHEQKMLWATSSEHPLYGHQASAGMLLKSFEGTLKVCERMGDVKWHHGFYLPKSEGGERMAFPYIGDLLLFCMGGENYPYCVNWTVKKYREDFSEKDYGKVKGPLKKQKDMLAAEFRHELEERYYRDAGIRTVRFVPDDIDVQVLVNLDLLFSWHHRSIPLEKNLVADLIEELSFGVVKGDTPFSIINRYLMYSSREHLLRVFYSAVWTRQLRVSLFDPILVDKPLREEKRDVLSVYQYLFDE